MISHWKATLEDSPPDANGVRVIVEPDGDPFGAITAAAMVIAGQVSRDAADVLLELEVLHDEDCPALATLQLPACCCAELWVQYRL